MVIVLMLHVELIGDSRKERPQGDQHALEVTSLKGRFHPPVSRFCGRRFLFRELGQQAEIERKPDFIMFRKDFS